MVSPMTVGIEVVRGVVSVIEAMTIGLEAHMSAIRD